MGCCGKTTILRQMASGYKNLMFPAHSNIPAEEATRRIAVCKDCQDSTYLSKTEYAAWLVSNGMDILVHLEDLSRLPPLEKHPFTPGRSLFCRLCKCWIPAKARADGAACPKDQWPHR